MFLNRQDINDIKKIVNNINLNDYNYIIILPLKVSYNKKFGDINIDKKNIQNMIKKLEKFFSTTYVENVYVYRDMELHLNDNKTFCVKKTIYDVKYLNSSLLIIGKETLIKRENIPILNRYDNEYIVKINNYNFDEIDLSFLNTNNINNHVEIRISLENININNMINKLEYINKLLN